MQVSDLVQHKNMLHLKLHIPGSYEEVISPEYTLCGVVLFQAKYRYSRNSYGSGDLSIFIKLTKIYESDHLTYTVKFTSEKLKKNETILCADASNWCQIYSSSYISGIDINLTLDVLSTCSGLFASLHEDSTLADFELCGDDGSVYVHKSILAGYSPFIRTMLKNSGEWNEVASGSVKVTDTTRETLQQLKDYMYLQKMPEHGAKELAVLASYYMMPDLEQRCAVKLISSLTANNVIELLEFALKYKIRMLVLAIFDYLKKDVIKVKDIEKAIFK